MVIGKNGAPSIIAEIVAGSRQRPADIRAYRERLKAYADRAQAPYMMLVTPSYIMIWARSQDTQDPVVKLNTEAILKEYNVFGTMPISETTLQIAAKQWLQDLILHWHSTNPPYSHELENVGILRAIRDGEVTLDSWL